MCVIMIYLSNDGDPKISINTVDICKNNNNIIHIENVKHMYHMQTTLETITEVTYIETLQVHAWRNSIGPNNLFYKCPWKIA